jgi:hypothetical protein
MKYVICGKPFVRKLQAIVQEVADDQLTKVNPTTNKNLCFKSMAFCATVGLCIGRWKQFWRAKNRTGLKNVQSGSCREEKKYVKEEAENMRVGG